MGPWWALVRSGGPPVPQKGDFLHPWGSIWVSLGGPWGYLGSLWGPFGARLRVKKRVLFPCDFQGHFLDYFGVFFKAFALFLDLADPREPRFGLR